MFIVLIRTIFLYSLLIFVMRLMGKRQIGELQPYEFVITILISDLVSMPMQDTRLPLILGIIPVITLLFVKTILSYIQLKSQLARRILEGEPCVLICAGKVNYNALKKQQINLDELMEEIRLAGYFDLEEIEYAILENNGQLSFLTTNINSNINIKGSTKANDKLNDTIDSANDIPNNHTVDNYNEITHPKLPIIYVVDGKINKNSLTTSGKSKEWIEIKLKQYSIDSIDKVLLAMTDTEGRFVYQLHDDYEKRCPQ